MINLTIGTNTKRTSVFAEPNQTLDQIFAANKVDVSKSALHLNGALIPGADTKRTLSELGIADGSEAMIIAVVKADSAN